ncbi:hypothetical protein C8Q72DRAFT_331045 [Fomitopsis betulina]|nr:hypothetical protein C8Q72DRAFT_331045 [Fomitopsis betulina]
MARIIALPDPGIAAGPRSTHAQSYIAPTISSIPPAEILEKIFLKHPGHARALKYPSRRWIECCSKISCCRDHCWFVVSHVCRRWRDVALGCRKLWACLRLSIHPDWMPELLRRSGNAQLLIDAYILSDHFGMPQLLRRREECLDSF